ncbi:MAG TPA: TetR/AcrR family transcriptional regulator [Methylibium sp.]|uniref:TetR/AcrR family transcriptional regulator n=1 Tax=Methylibium sp. TaxID=2067992 RepID=UPI002DC00088|nr:TetR/AcrR family transcriptional regulator [Methylibium sp.]HEU4458089.1 TetR/AcrR family transcriptional regulator [Methylibium sp.]
MSLVPDPHVLHDSPGTPTRQRRKDARPQELLDAALELFVEKGFAATRSEEVAARAGVSKGTLYLYYPSKEELLKAVIRENLSREIAEGVDIVRGFEGSTPELLDHLMHEWWRRIGLTPASGICKLIVSEVRNFPEIAAFYLQEVVEPCERMMGSVIERGIERGEFRAVPTAEVVHALMAPMLFMMLHQHSIGACPVAAGRLDPLRVIERQIDLVLNGLVPRPAAKKPASRARGAKR